MILAERGAAVRQSLASDVKSAKIFYKEANKVLNSDEPADEFFMQANAMFFMLVYPLYAVPSVIVGSIRAFLRTPNGIA